MEDRLNCGTQIALWRIYCTVKLGLYCGEWSVLGRVRYTAECSIYCRY
jgi:hypothetical protein